MRSVHLGPVASLVGQLGLLTVLALTVGLGRGALLVGTACGVATAVLLGQAYARRGSGPSPADWVTMTRAVLVGGVAALVVASWSSPTSTSLLVGLSSVALALDAVDGRVARRTGTVTGLGARYDMEVDAFLILVLSVFVAPAVGWWVLLIGAARYLLWLGERVAPWLRRPVPPRYWRKVVAAVQGIVLTVAAAAVLPDPLTSAALVVALALLAESFGRDVWWLWGRRHDAVVAPPAPRSSGPVGAAVLTTAATTTVWLALVSPDRLAPPQLGELLRLPVEGLLVVGVALLLRGRAQRLAAVLLGALLGLLVVVRILDVGFTTALGRPFDPVSDWSYAGSAVGLLSASIGRPDAVAALVAAGLVCIGLLVVLPLAVLRLTDVLERNRRRTARTVTALGLAWVACFALGVQVVPGTPVAAASAATLAVDQVRQVQAGLTDEATFAEASMTDGYRITPAADLLTGLRGKDVLFVFVESYGRVAVDGATSAPGVDSVLAAGTRELADAGFGARSAYLTSPTFGGISWLAHSTLQSGLWVDSQQRYDQLVASNRLTLSGAFARAGWRTVADVPSNERAWPEGQSFYGYDTVYDGTNVGYQGPAFSYAAMPDQYTLAAFQRMELAGPHRPVMAEIDLVSSHTPWAPLPRLVDWTQVGDGSVFDGMPEEGAPPAQVWRSPDQVRAAYTDSIVYSLESLISFVTTYGNDDTVLVVLGDHQPATIVSGVDASHDVPVSVIARDPAVLNRISDWGWADGLRPRDSGPVWRMDAFRDRFLGAFGPTG